MVMAKRPEVATAPAPIAVVDTVLLVQQVAAALIRVPFRNPLRGHSSPVTSLGASITREVVRSFMGYSSSLPIDEFRSIEQLLDTLCTAVMPPVVAAYGVQAHLTTFGGVPGILYLPPGRNPSGVILYLHGGGYIGTSPRMYSFFTAPLCRETGCAIFVADYRLAPEFPYPAGLEDAAAVITEFSNRGLPADRIFVAGDSGGGGLANTLMLTALARADTLRPAGLILFSPEVDLELDEPSVTENAALDILPWNIPTAAYLHGVDPYEGIVERGVRRPGRFPSDVRDVGCRRDVPRSHSTVREAARRRGRHELRVGGSGDVPRFPDPGAVGREQSARPSRRRDVRARPARPCHRSDARLRLGVLTQSDPAQAMIEACSSAARRCTSASRYHGSEIIARNAARFGYQTVSTSS